MCYRTLGETGLRIRTRRGDLGGSGTALLHGLSGGATGAAGAGRRGRWREQLGDVVDQPAVPALAEADLAAVLAGPLATLDRDDRHAPRDPVVVARVQVEVHQLVPLHRLDLAVVRTVLHPVELLDEVGL